MRTRYYCTYFDKNYLARALALYESLRLHGGDFQLDVLCLDANTEALLERLALPGVKFFSLGELEKADGALASAKHNRSWVEFIWTLTPSLIQHSLRRQPDVDIVTYIDSDLFFFSSPEPIFEEMGEASVTVIPHRFAKNAAEQIAYSGIYNVGMMTFRRDRRAAEALEWWRSQCLEACHAEARDGKFGDQKYLDDWPERFQGVKVIANPGANLAPWNVGQYTIARRENALYVDEKAVIFYHFHRLHILGLNWFQAKGISRKNVGLIYRPYFRAIQRAYRLLRTVSPGFDAGIVRIGWLTVWSWLRFRRFSFFYERE